MYTIHIINLFLLLFYTYVYENENIKKVTNTSTYIISTIKTQILK